MSNVLYNGYYKVNLLVFFLSSRVTTTSWKRYSNNRDRPYQGFRVRSVRSWYGVIYYCVFKFTIIRHADFFFYTQTIKKRLLTNNCILRMWIHKCIGTTGESDMLAQMPIQTWPPFVSKNYCIFWPTYYSLSELVS